MNTIRAYKVNKKKIKHRKRKNREYFLRLQRSLENLRGVEVGEE